MRLSAVAVCVGGVLTLAGVCWLVWPRSTPAREIARFEEPIRSGDWGAMYDMSHPEEFVARGVTRDQFVRLMSGCVSHLTVSERTAFTKDELTVQGSTGHRYVLTFPRLKKSVGVGVYRGADRWYASVSALPMFFVFAKRDHAAGARAFSSALMQSGLTEYRIFEAKIACSTKQLDRVANGEIPLRSAYVRSP